MIAEAIQDIRSNTEACMTPEIVNLDSVPAGADYLLTDPYAKTIAKWTKEPPPLGARFECLDAFVDAITILHDAGVFDKSFVFWSKGRGYCFQPTQKDHGYKRDNLRLLLTIDPRFAKLQELSTQRRPLGHKAFNRMLSVDLVNTMDDATRLQLRTLAFSRAANAKSDVQITKNTYASDIKSEVVAGEKGLPEYIDLTLRCYRDLAELPAAPSAPDLVAAKSLSLGVTVRCALHIELDEETLDLQPLPGAVDQVMNSTDDLICESMRKDLEAVKTTVLVGVPVDFPGGRP